jgi:hypothetical protein
MMIRRGDIINASFDVRRRAKQARAFERGDHVLVVPFDKSKVMRCVSFMPNGQVLCQAYETGEICEANSYQNICYHAFSANRRREINKKRRQTLAKKQGSKAA